MEKSERKEFVVQYIVKDEESFLKFQNISYNIEEEKLDFESEKLKWEKNKEKKWNTAKKLEVLNDNELIAIQKRQFGEERELWFSIYKKAMGLCTMICCFIFANIVTSAATSEISGSDYSNKPQAEKNKIYWSLVFIFTLMGLVVFFLCFSLIVTIFIDSCKEYYANIQNKYI
jgi:hypothetical protein